MPQLMFQSKYSNAYIKLTYLGTKALRNQQYLPKILNPSGNKYKLRHIQLVTGISYSNVQRLLNAGEGKKCKSKITETRTKCQ